MYWKVEEFRDDDDNIWLIYNYIEFISTVNPKPPFYNGVLKRFTFYPNKHMIIKAAIFDSEDAFLEWWEQNKNL